MDFESIDTYLLDGNPAKPQLIADLLDHRSNVPAARPFYEGMQILGARTPDLAIIALRLALAGKTPGDEEVSALRSIVEEARRGGSGGAAARAAYAATVGIPTAR